MLGSITYLLSAPRRWWRRRGFGVQSPWAFEFVTQVLFTDSWYYFFDETEGGKSDRQLFRIVCHLKPSNIIVHTDNPTVTNYLTTPMSKNPSLRGDGTLHYYDAQHLDDLQLDINNRQFADADCLIIDAPYTQLDTLLAQISSLPLTTVFHMKNRLIAFFDPKRQRQTFVL